jgi:hypothetical protein
MFQELGYHKPMKDLNRAWVAGFALATMVLVWTSTASAQINGAPPSVTSIGFGGAPGSIHGPAASVTSLGPQGYTPGYSQFPRNNGLFGTNSGNNINGHGHGHPPGYYPWGGGYYYAVPYYGYGYDDGSGSGDPPPPDDSYNGGPTVFDRRGPGPGGPGAGAPGPVGAGPGAPGPASIAAPASEAADADIGSTTAAQPETVLVFKDGHQLEVENYAIIGSTLYDLTPGRKHNIALNELDLTATIKENGDRGVDFQVPPTSAAN